MRKRSKYRPRRVDPLAWAQAISMKHKMGDDQLQDLGLAIHGAIERMRIGHGSERDFTDLAAIVNVSLIHCERGVGAEHEQLVKDAQDALMRVAIRARATGRWAFDGDGYSAITSAVDLHEQQIALVSRDANKSAMIECGKRMQRGQVLEVEA